MLITQTWCRRFFFSHCVGGMCVCSIKLKHRAKYRNSSLTGNPHIHIESMARNKIYCRFVCDKTHRLDFVWFEFLVYLNCYYNYNLISIFLSRLHIGKWERLWIFWKQSETRRNKFNAKINAKMILLQEIYLKDPIFHHKIFLQWNVFLTCSK